jgi:hypothetical protein
MRITLDLNCGEDTCASRKGSLCQFIVTRLDGSKPRCDLFNELLFDDEDNITGWLLRCEECKEAGK